MGKIEIGGRRAHGHSLPAPLDDRILVFFIDAPVDDRVGCGQLELTHFTVAINAMAFLQLGVAEVALPIVFEFTEPEFKRLRGIDSFRTVRLHPT